MNICMYINIKILYVNIYMYYYILLYNNSQKEKNVLSRKFHMCYFYLEI